MSQKYYHEVRVRNIITKWVPIIYRILQYRKLTLERAPYLPRIIVDIEHTQHKAGHVYYHNSHDYIRNSKEMYVKVATIFHAL